MAETGHPSEVGQPSEHHSPPPVRHTSEHVDPNRRLSQEAPHGLGETEEQHALHAHIPQKKLWGLDLRNEAILFYILMVTSIGCEIAAAVCGAYRHTWSKPFIGTMTAFLALHVWAWLQTAVGMVQRASWVRDEGDLATRRQFLYLAVRLNRLMLPTAIVALATFIQAYARRHSLGDLAYWLLFLLVFIWNIVFSVMNAYNNITWESDRLEYEEGENPFSHSRLAILGIPSSAASVKKARREGKGKEV